MSTCFVIWPLNDSAESTLGRNFAWVLQAKNIKQLIIIEEDVVFDRDGVRPGSAFRMGKNEIF